MDLMSIRRGLMAQMARSISVVQGSYTPAEDIYSNNVQIPNSLGVVPDFIIAYADGIEPNVSDQVSYIVMGMCTKINATSPQTTYDHQAFIQSTRQTYYQILYNVSNDDGSKYLNVEWVKIPYYNTAQYLKAGVTYHYVYGKYTG